MLFCFFSIFITVSAKDRYIFFIENAHYNDFRNYSNLKFLIDNSVNGLLIQRTNGGEFAFFKSLDCRKPSRLLEKEIPTLNINERNKPITIYGFVEKDGTFYVPSKILLYGQTFKDFKSKIDDKITMIHIGNIIELDEQIGILRKNNNNIIIICSWVRDSQKKYDRYILPFIYYDGLKNGVFYSETTRNKGIIDYENASKMIIGNIENLKIREGNIEKIYSTRIKSLKEKKAFLIYYGYFMGIIILINCILLKLVKKKYVKYLSLFSILLPLSVLVEPIMNSYAFKERVFIIILLNIVFLIITRSINFKWIPIIFLVMIYGISIVSSYILSTSLLSYEPALGARFYGIGNEYLGIILAYILLLIEEIRIKKTWYIWFLNSIALLYNNSGNNFGGFLTTFSLAIISAPCIFTVIFALLSIFLIIRSKNHINIFFFNLFSGDFVYVKNIIKSKNQTFYRLLSLNLWTELSIMSILIYSYNFLKNRIKEKSNIKLFLTCCFLVVIFNDSGMVSCALIMAIYLNYIFYKMSLEG